MSTCLAHGTKSHIESVLQSEGLLLTQSSEKLGADDLKDDSMSSAFVKKKCIGALSPLHPPNLGNISALFPNGANKFTIDF